MVRGPANPCRHYCFTLYAPDHLSDGAQRDWLVERAERWTTAPLPQHVRFIVCQLERGNERNHLHLQGYVQLLRPQRFTFLHRVLDSRLSCLQVNGTAEENLVYCTKEDTRVEGPWRAGRMVHQGTRSDLDSLRESIRAGASDLELYENHFSAMAKYPRVASAYRGVLVRARTAGGAPGTEPAREPLSVYVYWGLPGTGKTRRALYEANDPCIVSCVGDKAWFDAYTPGQDIVLDEFDGELPINQLKRLLDIYPVDLSVKGSHVARDCRRIFITSNSDPVNWYPNVAAVHRDALFRRFTHVEQLTAAWVPPAAPPPHSNPVPSNLSPSPLLPSSPAPQPSTPPPTCSPPTSPRSSLPPILRRSGAFRAHRQRFLRHLDLLAEEE